MRFLYKKYQAKKKEIIQVRTDGRTKVKFLTARDFKQYQRGKTHRYYGGTFDAGEVKFVCPFDSVWHAVVEQGTYSEPINISATCSLLPPDRGTLSTIALDAPTSVKNAIENSEVDSEHDSEELDLMEDTADELVEDDSEGDKS